MTNGLIHLQAGENRNWLLALGRRCKLGFSIVVPSMETPMASVHVCSASRSRSHLTTLWIHDGTFILLLSSHFFVTWIRHSVVSTLTAFVFMWIHGTNFTCP